MIQYIQNNHAWFNARKNLWDNTRMKINSDSRNNITFTKDSLSQWVWDKVTETDRGTPQEGYESGSEAEYEVNRINV